MQKLSNIEATKRVAQTIHSESSKEDIVTLTSMELEVIQIFSDVLGVGHVGVHDDFFALGGNSLSALKIVWRIADCLNIELPLSDFYAAPSVESLARQISEIQANQADDGCTEGGIL